MISWHPTTTIRWTRAFSSRAPSKNELAWISPASSFSKSNSALTPVAVPVMDAPVVIPVMTPVSVMASVIIPVMSAVMPRRDVDHPSRAVIVVVAVGIVPGTAPVVSARKTKVEVYRDPRFRSRRRGKREGANRQTDQKKLFPIHIKSPLRLIIEHHL